MDLCCVSIGALSFFSIVYLMHLEKRGPRRKPVEAVVKRPAPTPTQAEERPDDKSLNIESLPVKRPREEPEPERKPPVTIVPMELLSLRVAKPIDDDTDSLVQTSSESEC